MCDDAYDVLKKFGFSDFRPGQREVIERILAGTHEHHLNVYALCCTRRQTTTPAVPVV